MIPTDKDDLFIRIPCNVLRMRISATAKVLYGRIALYSGANRKGVAVSFSKLSEELSEGKQPLMRAMKELIDSGLIQSEKSIGAKNRYYTQTSIKNDTSM